MQGVGKTTLQNRTAPATPGAGLLEVWSDSTLKVLRGKNEDGTLFSIVVPSSAGPGQFATGISAAGVISYAKPTPRVTSISSNAAWSPSADTDDEYVITAQAAAVDTISNPSGTPVEGQKLMFRIKDDGTARALTWSGTQWRASPDLALPTTTIVNKTMYLGFIWNGTDSKWDLLAKLDNF